MNIFFIQLKKENFIFRKMVKFRRFLILEKMKKMIFEQIKVGEMENFVYLVGDEKSREIAVIDAGFEPEKIIAAAKKHGKITKIFLTHFHYDHSGAAEILAEKTGAEIFGSGKSAWKRGKNETRGAWKIPEKVTAIDENSEISIGEIPGTVLEIPGHQNDHLGFLFGKYFFSGDTVFVGRIGRTDFADSDPAKMRESLRKIAKLPDDLILSPGHDYGVVPRRTLGEEKRENEFLKSL